MFLKTESFEHNGVTVTLSESGGHRAVSGAVVSGTAGRCSAVLFWFIGAESRRNLLRRRRAAAPYS
ncbi:hypothetical protein F7N61_05130 [Escherichia coli]|nr:hypothetical protein [Escherichia coli]